ncbi:hypothetical protein KZZ52_17185 [Dactylosporangium sp. AC04546]|uniref:hypothetical protein n=1 Tax=Dactylosporangium sp. AC04546 TaxID=2862460 RepID=UPI001EDCBC8D|nr:hypothetical protein [Dactylosporangium sp. AC04546]WVK87032.1 hypothetical protein KZZ52_17185 [Dactylosporangium sp. AC04546]
MTNEADSAREARVVALLEHNIRTELLVMNAGYELGLGNAIVERLAEGITSGVLYAFAVDWSPDWVKPGQVHTWEEDGAFLARCSTCLLDSPPAHNRESAEAWVRQHETQH